MSMTTMNRVTHTIRRAAGGCSHFARVTVSLDNEPVAAPDGDVSPEWIKACNAGVQHALNELGSTSAVRVVEIQGTDADTRSDTLFAASAIAAFRVLGDLRHVERFTDSKWEVAEKES